MVSSACYRARTAGACLPWWAAVLGLETGFCTFSDYQAIAWLTRCRSCMKRRGDFLVLVSVILRFYNSRHWCICASSPGPSSSLARQGHVRPRHGEPSPPTYTSVDLASFGLSCTTALLLSACTRSLLRVRSSLHVHAIVEIRLCPPVTLQLHDYVQKCPHTQLMSCRPGSSVIYKL